MTVSDQSPAVSRDLDAIVTQTQAAALRLLEPAALTGLQRELRAMKEAAADEPMRKTLAKAVQRIAAEKRRREGAGSEAGTAAAPAPAPAGADKADRAEKKRLKEAEQAEKKRAKEAEKSERQAARKAEKQAARKAAKLSGQGGDKPARPAGAAAGAGPKGSGKPGKAKGKKAE